MIKVYKAPIPETDASAIVNYLAATYQTTRAGRGASPPLTVILISAVSAEDRFLAVSGRSPADLEWQQRVERAHSELASERSVMVRFFRTQAYRERLLRV